MVDGPDSTGFQQTTLVARSLVVLRLACAGVLGFAAAAKLLKPVLLAEFLAGLTHLGLVVGWTLAVVLIAVEAVAAVALLTARWASKGGALAAVVGTGFLLYHVNGGAALGGCPCFGELVRLDPVSGSLIAVMLMVSGVAIASPAVLGGAALVLERRLLVRAVATGTLAWAMLLGLYHWSIGRGIAALQAAAAQPAQPKEWMQAGTPLPEVPITVGGRATTLRTVVGEQPCVVSVLSPGCGNCRAAVEYLRARRAAGAGVRWLILLEDSDQLTQFVREFGGKPDELVGAESDGWRHRAGIPLSTHLWYVDGRLQEVSWQPTEVVEWLSPAGSADIAGAP